MPSCHIRLLTPKDTLIFQTLRLQSLQTNPASFVSTYTFESNLSTNYFSNRLQPQEKPSGIYGIFLNQQITGYAQITREWLPKIAHIANIYEVYISPPFRSQGLATKLVSHLIDLSRRTLNLEQLHLRVNSTNKPAISFYNKLGFSQIATRPHVIKESPTTYQDELWYVFHLHQQSTP